MDHLKHNSVLRKAIEWLFLISYYGKCELAPPTLLLGHDMTMTTDSIIFNIL